jgi:hypothetical protein
MKDTPLDAEARATAAGWPDLAEELELWGDAGRVATLWWRDDDATAASAELDRLLALAAGIPVALAVVPGFAEHGLAARLELPDASAVAVLQHGWRHADHATLGRKSEFPPERPWVRAAADLAAGRARLREMFGGRTLAVLAPPWNRFDRRFLPLLAGCGIAAISEAGPRRSAWPRADVFAANVHVDLVAWAQGRRFVGEAAALALLVGHLRARRLGFVDNAEPTGIMTHHLLRDAAAEDFLCRLLALTAAHPAARWLDAGEVFAPAPDSPA